MAASAAIQSTRKNNNKGVDDVYGHECVSEKCVCAVFLYIFIIFVVLSVYNHKKTLENKDKN